MKSFILKGKQPIIKWGRIPHGTFFEGSVPEGYSLAICPNDPYIILDIDLKPELNGYHNIPIEIYNILFKIHFHYKTKSGGSHIWLKYTGNKQLKNRATKLGLDLRTSSGYVKWYLDGDIRNHIDDIKETNEELNNWLENLFA
jgi:hypothetical protein